MPLQCNALEVHVHVDDVLFPAYPGERLEEEIRELHARIDAAKREIADAREAIRKKSAQVVSLRTPPDEPIDAEVAQKRESQAKSVEKQVAKLTTRVSTSEEEIARAKERIEQHRAILSVTDDEMVQLVVTVNDAVLVKEAFSHLPRSHTVIRLDASKRIPLPIDQVEITASLTGRWRDEKLKATLLRHVPMDDRRIGDMQRRRGVLLSLLDGITGPDIPPESEFDEEYIDRMDALEEYRDQIDALRSQIQSLDDELAKLTPTFYSSDIEKTGLVWRSEDGASVVNGRTFRLQIRVEVLYEVRDTRLPLLRSHSIQQSSSNTVADDRVILIHNASHFGDKHALAGTLALYDDYRAVIADDPRAAAAQRQMRWYLDMTGGVRNPCILAAQSVLDAHIIPFLTGPGSATRLVANRFRQDGTEATLRKLRKRWLKLEDSGEPQEEVAPHLKAVSDWLVSNGRGLPGGDHERLMSPDVRKVILWQRAKPFKTEGNPSKELIYQLAGELASRGLVPLIIGETFPLSNEEKAATSAIDFTSHWRHDVFSKEDSNHLRQVYMFHLLARHAGLVGVIGGKSGSLECTAMLGISTMWFCNGAPPYYEPRLYQWDMIPHYRAISIAGLVQTSRPRGGPSMTMEPVPYAEQRIGLLCGRPLGLVRACLDEIVRRGGPCVDLSGVEPAKVVEIKEMV